jgi:hypothetical protein
MTIASGAGFSCAEKYTRNLPSNQKMFGTGRAHGIRTLISTNGTVAGMGAMSCGGVPNIVARRAEESARPVAGPFATGAAMTVDFWSSANVAEAGVSMRAPVVTTPVARHAAA